MKKFLFVVAFALPLLAPPVADAKRINVSMNFGQDVLLASNGPVTLRARCLLNSGGADLVQVYATTTSNAVMRSPNASYSGNGSYLTAVTPVGSSLLASHGTLTTGDESVSNTIDGSFVVNIESMRGFAIRVESSVFGVNTGGDDCLLSLEFTAIKKFKIPN